MTSVLLPDGADTLITASEAATVCGVTLAAVNNWRKRGKLQPAGLDGVPIPGHPHGRYVYRLRDVATVELSTRKRGRR